MATTILSIDNSVYNVGGGYICNYFYLEVILNSQDIIGNKSNITVNHYGKSNTSTGGGYSGFSTPKSYINVQNTEVKTTTVGSIPTNGTKTLIGTWTGDIGHNADGTLNLVVSARYAPNTDSYYYLPRENTLSGTVAVATIPRASSISAPDYTITNAGNSYSAIITPKTSYRHRWRWKMDNGSWTGWTNLTTPTSSAITITISNQTILQKLPSATSGSLTIEVETHSGTGSTYSSSTLVGSNVNSGTITISTSSIKPSVSVGAIGVNSTPISGYLVAGNSKAQSAIGASGAYGSTIVSITVRFRNHSDGDAVIQAITLNSAGTAISNILPSSSSDYFLYVDATATDSRGATNTASTGNKTVFGYTQPLATLSAYRTTTSTSTNKDDAGEYVYVTFSGTIRGSVNNQNTIQSTTCTMSGDLSGSATSGTHYDLADDKKATFTLTVTDKISSSTTVVYITDAKYPIDLYDNGSGQIGVGFGTIAEGGLVKTPLTIQHRNHYVQKVLDANGTVYFLTLCTITITGKNVNTPIYMRVDGRGDSGFDAPVDLSLRFVNTGDTTDPGVDLFFASRNVDFRFYIYKAETSVWKVCVRAGGWDRPVLTDFQTTSYQEHRMTVDFTQDYVTALPDGAIVATQWLWPRSSTANNATYANWTETNPSSLTNYYLPFGAGYSTNNSNRGLLSNNGIWYRTRQGTASALGYSILNLGNATASGTAGNKRGQLRLYADDATYTDICSQTGGGGSVAYLPKIATDSYLQCSKSIWTGSLTGTNSINLDISPYKRIRIYALYATDRQMIWEVDVTKLHASTQYRCNHCEISWIDSAWFHTIFETFISKAKFTLSNVYNMDMSGTTYAQNNNASYKIYQIDGII